MLRRVALVALLVMVGASSATAATPKKFTPAALAGTWPGRGRTRPSTRPAR
jgi:hypothetical protein